LEESGMAVLSKYLLKRLVCPISRQAIHLDDNLLCRPDGVRYPIFNGVPSFRLPHVDGEAPSQKRLQVSLLIMTRNEEECISSAIVKAREVLDDLELSYEVLVVDGNSTDTTVQQAQAAGARVIAQSLPGYSAAFRQGLDECTGEYIVTIDADLSHDPNFIRSLWQARQGAEVVIGSRYVSHGGAEMPKDREYMSRAMNGFLRRLLGIPVCDLSSGLRLYHASAVKGLQLEGFEFDVLIEVLARYCNEGYLAREVPFFYKPRSGGRTKVRLLRFAWAYLRATLRLFPLRHCSAAADYELRSFDNLLTPGRKAREKRCAAIMTLLDGAISDLALIGCGAGKLVVSLPGAVCVDDSLPRLRILRRTHTMLVHADFHALPFADESFGWAIAGPDMAISSSTSFAEVSRILRPGGFLLVATNGQDTPASEFFELIQALAPSAGETIHKFRKL
jgi:hypothetical protein